VLIPVSEREKSRREKREKTVEGEKDDTATRIPNKENSIEKAPYNSN
jgi:hypothetical protein